MANQDDFALARFNADGTLDTGFGTAGKVSTDFYGNSDQARRVRIVRLVAAVTLPGQFVLEVAAAVAGGTVELRVAAAAL